MDLFSNARDVVLLSRYFQVLQWWGRVDLPPSTVFAPMELLERVIQHEPFHDRRVIERMKKRLEDLRLLLRDAGTPSRLRRSSASRVSSASGQGGSSDDNDQESDGEESEVEHAHVDFASTTGEAKSLERVIGATSSSGEEDEEDGADGDGHGDDGRRLTDDSDGSEGSESDDGLSPFATRTDAARSSGVDVSVSARSSVNDDTIISSPTDNLVKRPSQVLFAGERYSLVSDAAVDADAVADLQAAEEMNRSIISTFPPSERWVLLAKELVGRTKRLSMLTAMRGGHASFDLLGEDTDDSKRKGVDEAVKRLKTAVVGIDLGRLAELYREHHMNILKKTRRDDLVVNEFSLEKNKAWDEE